MPAVLSPKPAPAEAGGACLPTCPTTLPRSRKSWQRPAPGRRLALPLYAARIPAGFPSPADDHVEGKLDLNEHLVRRPASTFFVRAVGASMTGAGIFDGDLLIVDRSVKASAGDIVIAAVHGDLTIKHLKRAGASWVLAAENPDFPDIPIGEAGCEIWGVVVHSVRSHRTR